MALEDAARAVTLAGNLLITQQVTEARLEVARLAGTRRVARIAGGNPCPLCAYLDGKIVPAELADDIAPPSHINCDCILSEVGDAEVGALDNLDLESPYLKQLIADHGHFHSPNGKYAVLRIPASPAGRDFTFRRGKNGQPGTLEWHRPRYQLSEFEGEQTGVTEVGARPGVVGQ